MRKLKLYIATSINGKIARKDGSIDWLESIPKPDEGDYGYGAFYDSIDITIQGYSTYKQIISWGIDFPYADKKNYVLTRKQELENTSDVEFISENHLKFIQQLKEQNGKDIWLIGGGQINTLLFNADLIDEIYLFIMPVVISSGIELFEALPMETNLSLHETIPYSSGAVELRYRVV